MRRCLIFGFLLVIATAAHGQGVDIHNAATWYQRAIDQFNQLSQEQRQLLADGWDYGNEPPPPEIRAAMVNAQGILQMFQRGAVQEYCDFHLDRSQGFDLVMPQLNWLRSLVKTANNDALLRLYDGDSAGAADRLAAIYRMSAHPSDDGIIISSLVGQAIFSLADRSAQFALDRGALSADDSATLLNAVNGLGGNDPFRFVEATASEQEIAVATFESKWDSDEERQHLLEVFATGDGPRDMALAALDKEGFAQAVDQYDKVMDRMVEAMALPDPEGAKAAVAEIQAEIEAGEHGPLAAVYMPAMSKVVEQKLKGEKMIADRIAVLQKLAAGEVKPEEVANAAIWYLRGIELLEKIEPAKLELVRAFAVDPGKVVMADLDALLADTQAQEVIDVFRDGSIKTRCDFTRNQLHVPPRIAQLYDPGMHDALRLLRADAARLARNGDRDGAVDRFSICCRVVGHLAGDPQLASALIAHHDFNATLAMIQSALNDHLLNNDSKEPLLQAVERISRKDPFGYLVALSAGRKDVAEQLGGPYLRNKQDADRQALAVETVKEYSGDHLLYLSTIFDTLAQNAKPAAPPDASATPASPGSLGYLPADALSRLNDILSMADVEAARNDVAVIAPMLARNDWDFFRDRTIPMIAIGGAAEQMRHARADLRRAHLLLSPQARAGGQGTPNSANLPPGGPSGGPAGNTEQPDRQHPD